MATMMYAVKMAGPQPDGADVYFKNPRCTKRCLLDSHADAVELAEREGGYVVEVKVPTRRPAAKRGACRV